MFRLILLLLTLLVTTSLALAEDAADNAEEAVVGEDAALLEEQDADAGIPSQTAEPHLCFASGKPWEPSPGRVEVIFAERAKLKRARFVNMAYFVHSLREFEAQGRALTTQRVSVVDYATFGTPNEHMIEVDRQNTNAWFVFTEKKVGDATAPYVYAFEARDAADAFKAKHGGKVLEYGDLLTKLAKQLGAAKAEAESGFAAELMN